MNYNESEINFLNENYPKYGPTFCAKKLNRSVVAVTEKASRMGLKKQGTAKHPSMQKVDPRLFWNIDREDISYLLGFLWADGYIVKYFSNVQHSSIRLEVQTDDILDLKPILDSIGNWSFTSRKRKDSWKETTTMSTNSVDIYDFLEENDYKIKSKVSPFKILQKIPENLHPEFWRGFFDGDGSLAFNEEARWKTAQLSGTFDQDWSCLENLLKSLNIKYGLYREKGINSWSKIQIQNTEGISKFLKYLMKSNIGLTRKSLKMKAFFEKWPKFK